MGGGGGSCWGEMGEPGTAGLIKTYQPEEPQNRGEKTDSMLLVTAMCSLNHVAAESRFSVDLQPWSLTQP